MKAIWKVAGDLSVSVRSWVSSVSAVNTLPARPMQRG